MKKNLILLFLGVLFAQFAMAQTIVVLDLPNPCSVCPATPMDNGIGCGGF